MSFTTWIKNSFFKDKDHWLLWAPVFFGLGIIFYFSFPNNSYFYPTLLFFLSAGLSIFFKNQIKFLITIVTAIFLIGFLWTKFFTEEISYTPTVKQKFYATAIGRIDDINSFYNPILKRNAYQITLKDVALYKAGSLDGDDFVKKEKVKKYKKKKYKKKKRSGLSRFARNDDLVNIDSKLSVSSLREGEDDAAIQKIPKRKKSKKESKTVIKNYLNVSGYQEIDREFLAVDYKTQNQNWVGNKYQNPPKKIILNVNTKLNDAKIGDVIQTRALLEPFKKPYYPGGYDPAFENYFKGIGSSGFAASDLKVLKARGENSFLQDIKILRQKIAKKILDQMDPTSGSIAVALLVGSQNFIPAGVMQDVRNSGLAHLLSISGLHFTLAAGIFFFSIRFLLSLNQYLTLGYDIKKISAAIAIFAGFFYLLLADMPVPAIRAFIVITLIFIAIILDLRPNAFRSLAVAALLILILSPNAIYSVSFQLSFAAILSLIVLADFTKKYQINSSERAIHIKFYFYFLGIILSSLAATIITTPFSIYYFNQYTQYGFLANLIAIPIASFITMPFGFLSIILMPFGLEKLAFYPMQISIGRIVDIAHFVSNLPHSYLTVKEISTSSFALIILGGLWFCLWQKNWRFLGFVPIILGIYLGYKTPTPDLLIHSEKKIFAFAYERKLIFSKPTKSKQSAIWAKKLGLNEFSDIDDLSDAEKENLQADCNKDYCQIFLKNKKIIALIGRNKITKICDENYDVIINLSHKYQLPKCAKAETVIDNEDLKRNGNYFLHLE